MTESELSTMLGMLKIDLGITAVAYDMRLWQYLQSAAEQIGREGVTVDGAKDAQLIVMYASWMWRKRDTGEGMPRMLRYMLNNRLFAEKVADNG